MEKKISLKFQGKKLVGLVNLPSKKAKTYPAVILVHGFAYNKRENVAEEKIGLFDVIANALNKKGIVTYRFDFLGCGESEGDFINETLTSEVKQLKAILKFIKKEPKIDKNKIGMLGMSFGTTGVVASQLIKDIKAIVLLASVSEPHKILKKLFGQGYNSNIISKRLRSTGDYTLVKPKFWEDLDEYNLPKLISNYYCPILVIHGQLDYIPISSADNFYKNANQPKKLVIIKGSDHGFYRPKERQKVRKKIANWFAEYLCQSNPIKNLIEDVTDKDWQKRISDYRLY